MGNPLSPVSAGARRCPAERKSPPSTNSLARPGTGDNRNALKLADILDSPVLDKGTSSLSAAVGQFVGDIGVKTNQAQVSSAAQKVVFDESVDSLQSVSGVNLDEEAANLVRYQQAYMAAAQMIRVADTIFQSVLAAVGH